MKDITKITIESLFSHRGEGGWDPLIDGVWNITDIPCLRIDKATYMSLDDQELAAVQTFIAEHGLENIVIGAPYGTDATFLLASQPTEVETWEGCFNYGAAAIVTNCPREILILAEND